MLWNAKNSDTLANWYLWEWVFGFWIFAKIISMLANEVGLNSWADLISCKYIFYLPAATQVPKSTQTSILSRIISKTSMNWGALYHFARISITYCSWPPLPACHLTSMFYFLKSPKTFILKRIPRVDVWNIIRFGIKWTKSHHITWAIRLLNEYSSPRLRRLRRGTPWFVFAIKHWYVWTEQEFWQKECCFWLIEAGFQKSMHSRCSVQNWVSHSWRCFHSQNRPNTLLIISKPRNHFVLKSIGRKSKATLFREQNLDCGPLIMCCYNPWHLNLKSMSTNENSRDFYGR